MCDNLKTAVQRILTGFLLLTQRLIAIISLTAWTQSGTFLLSQSYIFIFTIIPTNE
jgi:hypothetical protein